MKKSSRSAHLRKVPSKDSHPHSGKHDGKVVLAVVHHVLGLFHQTSLTTNLSCNLKREVGDRDIQTAKDYLEIFAQVIDVCKCVSEQVCAPHCEAVLQLRRWVSSVLGRCCSCHRWQIFQFGSFPRGRYDTEG